MTTTEPKYPHIIGLLEAASVAIKTTADRARQRLASLPEAQREGWQGDKLHEALSLLDRLHRDVRCVSATLPTLLDLEG